MVVSRAVYLVRALSNKQSTVHAPLSYSVALSRIQKFPSTRGQNVRWRAPVETKAIEDYSFSYLKIVFLGGPLSWGGAKRKVGGEWRKGVIYIKDWFKNQSSRSFYLDCLATFSTHIICDTSGRFCPKLRLWLPPALLVTLSSLTSTSYPPIDSVEFTLQPAIFCLIMRLRPWRSRKETP